MAVLFDWDVPSETVTGVGTAVFTPNNTTGNSVVASTTDDNGGVGDSSAASNFGTVTINTTAVVPCNMHIKVTYTGPGVGVDMGSGWFCQILNQTMGGPALIFEEGNGVIGNLNNEYDVPFDLPNTGGVNNIMEWGASSTSGDGVGSASTMLVELTFTVL